MSIEAKIHLSTFEMELIRNKEWILTKQVIIDKVGNLFGGLNENFKEMSRQEEVFLQQFYKNTGGKISKGENYEGLPYVMLDYPAMFSRENIFAIRTMFWWGNFFSITLHLSGDRFKLEGDFDELLTYLKENNFFICVSENEWLHNFGTSNYMSAWECGTKQFEEISKKNFFKISKKMELGKWDEATEFLSKSFVEIIDFIKISFPGGERVLSPGFPKAGSGL
ncbi:MAG: hypothetical protein ABI416_08430 [Ginsengibacter sp.]